MLKRLYCWIRNWFVSRKTVVVQEPAKLGYPTPCKRRPPAEKISFKCNYCEEIHIDYASKYPKLNNSYISYMEQIAKQLDIPFNSFEEIRRNCVCPKCWKVTILERNYPLTHDINFIDMKEIE